MFYRLKIHLLMLLSLGLAGCAEFVEIATQAGDKGLVWPLPPSTTRMWYEEEIDINQTMSTSAGVITGGRNDIQIVRPLRLAVLRDTIAMIDYDRGSVYVIDRYHKSVITLKQDNKTQLVAISDVAIDDLKRIYLIDSLKGQVVVYQDDGRFIRRFGSALLWTKPDRITVDVMRQRIFVADSFQGRVYVFSMSGVFLYMFGEQGDRDRGRFSSISDLITDIDGNLYVLESVAMRIQKFDYRGVWLETIKLDKTYFREPVAIAVEQDQVFYIADRHHSKISVVDKSGKEVISIGGLGRLRGKFSDLTDISFDQYRQRLFSAETGTSRLQVLRRTPDEWLPFP